MDADRLYEQADFLVKYRKEHGPDPKPARRVLRKDAPKPRNPAQRLRRDGHVVALYDRRIGMTVCRLAHAEHHARIRPIYRDEVPTEVRSFIADLGYTDWFERVYPVREEEAA